MTSPVDTSVKFFSSAMSGAPVLSGTAGSLIGVLDACLKDGFDVKTAASVVVAAGVCTINWVGNHSSLPDCVILVAGVTDKTALNGEQKVVTKGATSLTFATAASDGTASGTITFKIAPVGWTKAFTGTNLAAYKSSDPAASGCYLRVDDSATTSARVVGYESMSDISTGVGPFPTVAQISGGGYWAKSSNANSTAVVWSLHADARFFYITIQAGTSSAVTRQVAASRCFGDPVTYRPGGDPYSCVLNYSSTSTLDSQTTGGVGTGADAVVSATPRDYSGLGSGVLAAIYAFTSAGTSTVSGTSNVMGPFPSAVDGGLWLSETYLANTGSFVPRAKMPGFYRCTQTGVWNTFKQNDRTPGTGTLTGRNLMAVTTSVTTFSQVSDATNTGIAMVDVTGPWR